MIARNVAVVISGLAVLTQAMLFNAEAIAGETQQPAKAQHPANKHGAAGKTGHAGPASAPAKQTLQAKAVQTTAAIQIRNLRLGMSTQEFVKEYPQLHVQQAAQNTERWTQADAYADPGSLLGNCLGDALKKPCASLAIVSGGAYMQGEFFFVDNRLSMAAIVVDIDDDLDVTAKKYLGLIDELSKSLNAKAEIVKQSQESLYEETPDASLRVAEWVNTSTKDRLTVKEDYYFADPDGHTLEVLMVAGSYENATRDRKVRLEQLRNEEKAKKEALRKQPPK